MPALPDKTSAENKAERLEFITVIVQKQLKCSISEMESVSGATVLS